jgi:hypothetical protein
MMAEAFHLGPEELDLYLDGRLPGNRTSHLETCEQCRTAAEETREVVAQLRALPRLAPGARFADLVMARVGLAGAAARRAEEHFSGEDLDLWVLGTLPAPREAHLRECPDCQALADAERVLVLRLEALPLFDPRPGFAERVLDGVDLPGISLVGSWQRWRRGVARNPLTVGMAAGVGGLLGGSIAASVAWTAGNQDTISGLSTWVMTHAQALFWQGVGSASLLLEQQSWYHSARAGLTPGRIVAVGGLTVALYAAGVFALRRLLALPAPGHARALS